MNTQRWMALAGALAIVGALGCSGSSASTGCDGGSCDGGGASRVVGTPTDGGCSASFAGQYAETDYSAGCCVVQKNTQGADLLVCTFDANLDRVNNQLTVDLGVQPAAGDLGSSVTNDWEMTSYSYSNTPANCSWQAAPGGTGGFTLHLATLEDPLDGGPIVAHGTLHVDEVTATVDTSSADGCGPGTESLDGTF